MSRSLLSCMHRQNYSLWAEHVLSYLNPLLCTLKPVDYQRNWACNASVVFLDMFMLAAITFRL
jgi:hypothetical protein